MDFVLIDTSQGAKTSNGESLSPSALQKAAAILTVYLNRDVSSEWGGNHKVRAGSSITDVLSTECAVDSQSTLVGAPGAIAYHDVVSDGAPVAYDGVTLSDSLFGNGNSWLIAIAHELAETVVDAGCNVVAVDTDGTAKAQEACDPVEEQSYLCIQGSTDGYVSNFVTREYFIPNSPGPYDFMSKSGRSGAVPPPGPMKVAPANGGNYQIVYSSVGSASQVTAIGKPIHRMAKKAHPLSRTARRGLQVTEHVR